MGDFSIKELKLIAHSLYQTNNHLNYARNVPEETKKLSGSIQRKINTYIKYVESFEP